MMRAPPNYEKAASEIVGTVVLITIFVAASAILLVLVSSQSSVQTMPALRINISSDGTVIGISHEGGESLPVNDITIYANGAPIAFTGAGSDQLWQIGETLTVTPPENLKNIQVTAQTESGRYLLASYGEGSPSGLPTVSPTGGTPPVAGFTAYPQSGNAPLTVSFVDTSFGDPVTYAWDIDNDGTTEYTSQNAVHTYLSPGTYSVKLTVSNAYGSNSLLQPNLITVYGLAPMVTGIVPASGYNDTTVAIGSLSGTGFAPGAAVKLNSTVYPDIAATGVTVVSPTEITCSFPLAGAPEGIRNIVVTNPDTQSGMLIDGFSVNRSLPAPTVTSMTNTTGYRGWPVVERITGTGFVTGSIPMLNRTGEPDIPASNIVVVSATQITCTFDLLNRTAGSYNLVVTNPDGKAGMRTAYFTLSSPAPTVSGSTPNSGSQGTTVTITNLAGTNFQPNAIVDYYLGSTRLNLTNVNVISRTQITGTLVIPVSATAGSYSVSVLNTDGRSGSSSGRFTVVSTVPTVTSMTNTTGYRGWPVIEQITGTNFVSGAVPMLNRTGYSDIIASNIVVVSSTQITCTFDLLEKNATTYNLVVTNPDGRAGMRTNYFTLSSPAPGVSSSPAFSPSSGARGATVTVTAPGTRLQPGMAVELTRSTTTLTGYGINVISPTQVVFTIDIPTGAAIGSYTARFMNSDGQSGSRTNRFSVTAPTTPVASFTGTPTSGTAPLTVAFTDASANSPTSWFWTFGDGGTSTAQNPTHQYTSAGSYTVSLMATNAAGSNTMTRANYITASTLSAPTASFTGSPTTGTVPLTVTFTDGSSGSPTSWSWTFGDGGTSTSQNPSHQYTTAGTYTVVLTATNAGGSNTLTRTNYITAGAPLTAAFTFAESGNSGNVVFQDASLGSPTSWSWTFGDGGTSTVQNPSHKYKKGASYIATLTILRSSDGATSTVSQTVTV